MPLLVTLRQVPYQSTFMLLIFKNTAIADQICACHGQETRCHPQWGRRVPLLPTMETLPPTVTLSSITIQRLMMSRRPSPAMDNYLKRTPSPLHPTWMKNLTQHGNHTGATSNRCSASEMSEGITWQFGKCIIPPKQHNPFHLPCFTKGQAALALSKYNCK